MESEFYSVGMCHHHADGLICFACSNFHLYTVYFHLSNSGYFYQTKPRMTAIAPSISYYKTYENEYCFFAVQNFFRRQGKLR